MKIKAKTKLVHEFVAEVSVQLIETEDGGHRTITTPLGLAKFREAQAEAPNLSISPTRVSGSMPGMIMGTATYMSPEQAKGKPVDRRTDVGSTAHLDGARGWLPREVFRPGGRSAERCFS